MNRIVFDAENRLWGVTSEGLYRAKSLTVTTGEFERVAAINTTNTPAQMMLDRRGRLWVSGNEKLLCVTDGSVTQYLLWEEAGETTGNIYTRLITGMTELADGRILLTTQKDLYEFIEPAAAGQRGSWRRLPFSLPPQNVIGMIHPAADGGLWVGTDAGLIRYRDGQQTKYRIGNDPNPYKILALFSDRDSNLWIGTRQRGLLKLRGEAISVYDARDGLLPVMDVY